MVRGIFLFKLFLLIFEATARPVGIENGGTRENYSTIPTKEMFDFMRKFGYLDKGPTNAEALYGELAVVEAIRLIQRYGALEETGELNQKTVDLMTSPRCGVADVVQHNQYIRHKRFVIGSKSWEKRKITYFIANWSSKVGEDEVAKYMKKAFAAWSLYSNLKFVQVFDTSADIIVGFGSRYHGDSYPFDGPGNILAHAFYPYEMNSYGGDIHFDEDENWKENSTDLSEGVDFYSVAIHELGHSLGLAHSPVYSSIMFPYYKGITQGTLDYDDVLAVYKLYIQNTNLTDDSVEENVENRTVPRVETTTFKLESTSKVEEIDRKEYEAEEESGSVENEEKEIENTSHFPVTFFGDYESVDDHKKRHNFSTPSPEFNQIPNICSGNFDAVSSIRGEIFIFKGEYTWRLTDNYTISAGYPVKIHSIFNGLPNYIHELDAVYERDNDNNIVLFSGKNYWVFDGMKFINQEPLPITDFGISEHIPKIDAAMVWAKNEKTYIFSGSLFWRYDEVRQSLDYGYPMNFMRWYGIPQDLDSAVTLANGKTYFFKGNYYWLFNNKNVRPERGYPRKTGSAWLGCK